MRRYGLLSEDTGGKPGKGGLFADGYGHVILNLTTSSQAYGSFFGVLNGECKNLTMENCTVTTNTRACGILGGIAGRCAHDGWNAKATDAQKTSNITISKCIAWNPSVTATEKGDVNSKGSSGAIVAYTYIKSTLSNCYRLSTMQFSGSYAECNPVDQPDASSSSPLTVGVQDTYCYPWHGVAAASDATVSSLATTLGWDTAIWDLSSAKPALR